MDKYIIYTMGIKEINEAVQKVLFEKGYGWHNGQEILKDQRMKYIVLNEGEGGLMRYGWDANEDYKELTFRELMELPSIHDTHEEIATQLVAKIHHMFDGDLSKVGPFNEVEWRKVWEKMKPKLGL